MRPRQKKSLKAKVEALTMCGFEKLWWEADPDVAKGLKLTGQDVS